ncbi:MAG: TetR/AcrR family transcriptional regulator [Firmicutes bacterium]|nr:TetR/AcrR family transcriptional regulator [Bacillota bacterium]
MASSRTRRIFQAAIDVFSEYGFEKATMDEIAARAGVAKGTVYYHFKSKEDLFVFLVEEGTKLLHEQVLARIPADAKAEQRLRVVIRELLAFFRANRDFCIIILREAWGEEGRQREFRRMLVHFVHAIREIIDAGVASGELMVEAPDTVSWSIFGAVSNTALHYLFMDKEYDLLSLSPQLERSLIHGFVSPAL